MKAQSALSIPPYLKHLPRNYYGNKAKLIRHILAVVPKSTKTFIDLFGGTMAVGLSVKHELGCKIICNDILRCNFYKGKVFVANNSTLLNDADRKLLTTPNKDQGNAASDLYGHFLGERNAAFLDNWISNIPKLNNPIKQDIAILLPVICIKRYFRYAATHFSPNGQPCGNLNLWEVDLKKDVLNFAHEKLPTLICDNGKNNEAYNEDAIGLLDRLSGDVLYVDSPYVASGGCGSYESSYHIWDDLIRVMMGKGDEIENRYDGRCELGNYHDFNTRSSSLMGFAEIFKRAAKIPLIILSYNTSSKILIEEIENIARVYGRNVRSQYVDFRIAITRKKNSSRTQEVLICCSNDRNY